MAAGGGVWTGLGWVVSAPICWRMRVRSSSEAPGVWRVCSRSLTMVAKVCSWAGVQRGCGVVAIWEAMDGAA